MPQNGVTTTLDPIFQQLPHFLELESTQATASNLRGWSATFRDDLVNWPLPLPYDILFTIFDQYLPDDQATIHSLSTTCRALGSLCRTFKFRIIRLHPRTGEAESPPKSSMSPAERFACLLAVYPDIIDLVHEIRISESQPHQWTGWRAESLENQSICFILTRVYPEASRLSISLFTAFSVLPESTKQALFTAFKLPKLHHVSFDKVFLPISVLAQLHRVTSLVLKGEISRPYLCRSENGVECAPFSLGVQDISYQAIALTNLFHALSPLQVTKLRTLSIYTRGVNLPALSSPLRSAVHLTSLEVWLMTEGGLPTPIPLGALTRLVTLTLTVDISMIRPHHAPNAIDEACTRFSWLATTIGSLPDPSPALSTITIYVRLFKSDLSSLSALPWGLLDAEFPFPDRVEARWPRLRLVSVLLWTNSPGDAIAMNVEHRERRLMRQRLPALCMMDLIKFYWSHDERNYWDM